MDMYEELISLLVNSFHLDRISDSHKCVPIDNQF